jgi:multidrug efflux pump
MRNLQNFGISSLSFLPGAIAGGAIGMLIIKPVNRVLGKYFHGFNQLFEYTTRIYGRMVGLGLRLCVIVVLLYVGLLALTGFAFARIPLGFIPSQDQGALVVNIQLPDSAAQERTLAVNAKAEKIALETPGVEHTIGIPGQSFVVNASSSNVGSMFITLKPFHERRDPALGADALAARLRQRFQKEIPEAKVSVFGRPSVPGLGNAGGFKLMVEVTGDVNFKNLEGQSSNLALKANKMPGLVGAFSSFRANTPQLYIDVDRAKVKTMNVPRTDGIDTLQV